MGSGEWGGSAPTPSSPVPGKEARHALRHQVSPQSLLGRLRGRPALIWFLIGGYPFFCHSPLLSNQAEENWNEKSTAEDYRKCPRVAATHEKRTRLQEATAAPCLVSGSERARA